MYDIYLSPPDVGELEQRYVMDAVSSGWVAPLGPDVDAFEAELANFVGAKHVVALSSGTAALHLALLAAGIKADDTVMCSTLTFAASAFAITYAGAVPVFVDSEAQSMNMDPQLLADTLAAGAKNNSLPQAIMVVDIFGQCADYEAIGGIAQRYEVPLIEDAAEALGASSLGQSAGTFGLCGAFSFNGNKIMTTSGGGAFLTDDGELAQRVRHLATQARQPLPWYEHEQVGYNYRMSNILAALGRAQLSRLPGFITRRGEIRNLYRQLLEPIGVEVVDDASWGQGNNWISVARFPKEGQPALAREALRSQRIESRPMWKPMHQQPVFSESPCHLSGVSDRLFADALCLPSATSMTADDVHKVVDVVKATLA